MSDASQGDPVTGVVVAGDDIEVRIGGEIDAASAATLQRRVNEVIESTTGAVVLDMSGVSFIDSTGIRVLIAVQQRASAQHRSFKLGEVSAQTRRVLDLGGLSALLGIDRTS